MVWYEIDYKDLFGNSAGGETSLYTPSGIRDFLFDHNGNRASSTMPSIYSREDTVIYHCEDSDLLGHTGDEFSLSLANENPVIDNRVYGHDLVRHYWIRKGRLHREIGPAVVSVEQERPISPGGHPRGYLYYREGLLSNARGPAELGPNADFGCKVMHDWSYKNRYIMPFKEELYPGKTIHIPTKSIAIVIQNLEDYVYEVLMGDRKFPVIGGQTLAKKFDYDYYMVVSFEGLFE